MSLKSEKRYVNGDVLINECRYDRGFVEIGFRIPEVIRGAGPILIGVISRQCVGGKFCYYGTGFRIGRYRRLRDAMAAALVDANTEISKRSALYAR